MRRAPLMFVPLFIAGAFLMFWFMRGACFPFFGTFRFPFLIMIGMMALCMVAMLAFHCAGRGRHSLCGWRDRPPRS